VVAGLVSTCLRVGYEELSWVSEKDCPCDELIAEFRAASRVNVGPEFWAARQLEERAKRSEGAAKVVHQDRRESRVQESIGLGQGSKAEGSTTIGPRINGRLFQLRTQMSIS
jgi:hypothetical protein